YRYRTPSAPMRAHTTRPAAPRPGAPPNPSTPVVNSRPPLHAPVSPISARQRACRRRLHRSASVPNRSRDARRRWRAPARDAMTTDMSDRADVVVVGAGVMGASIAHWLCAGGAGRVALVDPRGPGGGMSGRSFRQVRRHHSNEVIIRLANRGFALI